MTSPGLPYRIFPLGDAALTIDFGNCIDENINKEVIARFNEFCLRPLPGMIETVPAYSSLTIYYDLALLKKKIKTDQTIWGWVKEAVEQRLQNPVIHYTTTEQLVRIPVCYEKEFAPDLLRLAAAKNISIEEVIAIHTATNYKVYMLGFLPGFAYMGEADERIAMPRKSQPVNVEAGSVGIAGKQTGIYPLSSPGGWQIIGRTPLSLFDARAKDPTILKTGDTVQFYSISRHEFEDH